MSKNNSKKQTDRDIVSQQFLTFRILENEIDIINIANKYNCKMNEIGDTTDHVKESTYKAVFNDAISNDKYTILLMDDSIIAMNYVFNNDGSLKEQTLSYLPNYRNNIDDREERYQDANIDEKIFYEKISNYIRVDYTELGREECIHTLVHMHVGVFKGGIRFPLQHFLYPYEFLFFIFKYLYHKTDEELKSIECDFMKESKLTELEMKRLRLVFGEIA